MIEEFCCKSKEEILGDLTNYHSQNHSSQASQQSGSWNKEINDMQRILHDKKGQIIFEYNIPRLGKYIDIVLLINGIIFVVEYKSWSQNYEKQALRQTTGYALSLKYYHSRSNDNWIVPILVATDAETIDKKEEYEKFKEDRVYKVIKCNSSNLGSTIDYFLSRIPYNGDREWEKEWEKGIFKVSPSIISAIRDIWGRNKVKDFKKGEADETTRLAAIDYIEKTVLNETKERNDGKKKSIVFVTGVPGAGKTLVGLHLSVDLQNEGASMLSGNGPLVNVLRTALRRDYQKYKKIGKLINNDDDEEDDKKDSSIDAIIMDAYGFKKEILNENNGRFEYLGEGRYSPRSGVEPCAQHIIIFDEAQRAWNQEKMIRPGQTGKKYWQEKEFPFSEPGLLLWDMDQSEWGVFVCLVGGGQEIHVGEAGISEWLKALVGMKNWHIYMSDKFHGDLYDSKEEDGKTVDEYRKIFENEDRLHLDDSLYLEAGQRSIRTENVSKFVEELLNCNQDEARNLYNEINKKGFKIFLTRDLDMARKKLRELRIEIANGEYQFDSNTKEVRDDMDDIRIGMLMSSKAARMRPLGYDIKKESQYKDKVANWFLDDSNNVNSSNFLEIALNEFFVQGLELDVTTVMWDADFRYNKEKNDWDYYEFNDRYWSPVIKKEQELKRFYMKNAYRVLLTRARRHMVIFVPGGSQVDATRAPEIYDSTYQYLKDIELEEI